MIQMISIKNKKKYRDEVKNFVGDKTELGNEKVLVKRYKHNTPNNLCKETLAKFAFSKDYTKDLIEFITNDK